MARKYTESKLLQLIELYLEGNSHQTLVDKYNFKLSYRPFKDYLQKYQLHGMEAIKHQKNNRRYTKEFKLQVVSEYLETGCGVNYLANKYNIPPKKTVNN